MFLEVNPAAATLYRLGFSHFSQMKRTIRLILHRHYLVNAYVISYSNIFKRLDIVKTLMSMFSTGPQPHDPSLQTVPQ